MELVILNEDQICSKCLQVIKKGEECLKFWNSLRTTPKNIRKGYTYLYSFRPVVIHYRHLRCQYETEQRKGSFEDYVALLRAQQQLKRENRQNKKEKIKIECEK